MNPDVYDSKECACNEWESEECERKGVHQREVCPKIVTVARMCNLNRFLPVWAVYRVNVHLMGAKDAIKNSFTVDDNVRTWALLEGTEDRVAWALEAVGLKHLSREPASILSMGQHKRLQLARLLAIPRSLWLLDKASVGLDLAGVELLEGMIEELRAFSPLFSPHSPAIPPPFPPPSPAQAPSTGSAARHPPLIVAIRRAIRGAGPGWR
ncbi:unnamed protein product [Closterium sp. Naga37s-1]|nr:unnamed protein product [Closterium sp. Naga37s-1]